MFGIGFTEMILIGVIALIFIGPDQIPETARTIGKLLNELRRSTDTLKEHINEAAKTANPMDKIIDETNKRFFQEDAPKYEHHQPEATEPKPEKKDEPQ